MDIAPDLSHLTVDERKIIEAVINRHKAEVQDDALATQSHEDDYSSPTPLPSRRHSQSTEAGVVCEICQKTKFVHAQSSRQCSICQKRFCVRCGFRLKNQTYVCNQCREKQELYFSSKKQFSKQYLSDYILTKTSENPSNHRCDYEQKHSNVPPTKNNNDGELSSTDSIAVCHQQKRLLPEIKLEPRSNKILRDFRYHSLEEKESGHEVTLKDSGIDTASSSTILNMIPADPFKKSMTNWRFNETRTEQLGYIYLKNPLDIDQEQFSYEDMFDALGLTIEATTRANYGYIAEVTKVIRGSLADTCGQLRIGDQVLEWNGEKLVNLSFEKLYRVISYSSMKSPHIQMIVKRVIRHPNDSSLRIQPIPAAEQATIDRTAENTAIQIQLSFQYDHRELRVMIYGARNVQVEQALLACQISVQYENDILSKEERCTKAQVCSSSLCTWNQHIRFFDLDTIDKLILTVKVINLDQQEDLLGEIQFSPLNVNSNKPEWYSLRENSPEASFNRILPAPADISLPPNDSRKRQLPNIPTARLHTNREKVSQELLEKATQLKLRLHLQSSHDKSFVSQHSFDQSDLMIRDRSNDPPSVIDRRSRQSMVNLSSSRQNLKDKPPLSIIRDKSAPNANLSRRTTMTTPSRNSVEKVQTKPLEDKYHKSMKKRDSSDATADDVDSDGSELSTASKMSSASMLSTKSERPRPARKPHVPARHNHPNLYRNDEIQLNDEELRQMAMRTHDTFTNTNADRSIIAETIPDSAAPVAPLPGTKTNKPDQRQDGALSDSILSSNADSSKKRRPSMSSKALVILGLSKKANSASNLGLGKRYGFQRSEEIGVQPHLRNRTLQRQTSKENETPTSAPPTNASQSPFTLAHQRDQYHSIPHDMKLWSGALNLPHERPFAEFIEGLGTGQLVGRQVLASPCHGEIQIGLRNQHGLLEVEIVRARNLLQKSLYKTPPAPYVKVYLLDGKTCVEKQRTRTTRRTLDPLIQQILIFKETYRDRVLQISVWGDYGKLDRKVFMGVCQVNLEEVNFNSSQQNLDWYKLFSANSLMNNYTISRGSSSHRRSSSSIHST